jgi:hypothetical protein
MKNLLLLLFIIFSCSKNEHAHEHEHKNSKSTSLEKIHFHSKDDGHDHEHAHKAHVHGYAKLSLAFEGTSGEAIFEISGHDLYGFEYQPKEDAEIKQRNDKLIFIRDYFSKLFQIENNKCLFSAKDIEVENIDNHTSVLATYSIKCDKALKQTNIIVNIGQHLKELEKLDVVVLSEGQSISKMLIKGLGVINIK